MHSNFINMKMWGKHILKSRKKSVLDSLLEDNDSDSNTYFDNSFSGMWKTYIWQD